VYRIHAVGMKPTLRSWKPVLQSFQTMLGEERVPLAAL
jgi:hypothetical protein